MRRSHSIGSALEPARADPRPRWVWPAILVGSLSIFAGLVHFAQMSFEVALQAHFLIIFVLILALERLLPYHDSWNRYDRQALNDFVYNITFPLSQLLAGSAALWMINRPEHIPLLQSADLPLPFLVRLVLLMIAIEFIYYIYHRAFHSIGILWRFHSLHHSSEQLHVLNNARVHPIEVFAAFLPILLFVNVAAVSPALLGWYLCLQLTIGLLTHCNVAVKCGLFSYVFNTPELHRWHHSPARSEQDNNYGSVIMIWDHLFRSYFNPADRQAPEKIGTDTPIPPGLFKQFIFPFKT